MASPDLVMRERYMEWLTTPTDQREIKSLRKLAVELGTSRQNLQKLKNDWRFAAEVQNRLSRHLDLAVIPDVMATMVAVATDVTNPRNVPAARTLLEYVKWNIERSEEVNLDVRQLSDDELRDLMISALDTIDERERTNSS